MATGGVDCDYVDCASGVELVHLIAAVDHRHVPFEQVDELLLAIREHGFQRTAIEGCQMVFDDTDHGTLPRSVPAHQGSGKSNSFHPEQMLGVELLKFVEGDLAG